MKRAGPYEPEEPWTILSDCFNAAVRERELDPLWRRAISEAAGHGEYTERYARHDGLSKYAKVRK